MPNEILVNPHDVRQSRSVSSPDIPVNAFESDIVAAQATMGAEALLHIGRDMVIVREFELMLQDIKKQGAYNGYSYAHAGPAHLSIGQEAAAVGQAFTLGPQDKVFGSHRSHGEVIAKGLSAIRQLGTDEALDRFRDWGDQSLWNVIKGHLADAQEPAVAGLLYGMTAETFGRAAGFNRGLGGSMHAFFPPFGIYPNNAIVGGSAPLATGAAMRVRLTNGPDLIVASIGDSSLGCGPVWESMNFAAMSQWSHLMKDGAGLPIVFFIVNNFYGMGSQPLGETMAQDVLARVGLGVNADGMHAQTIDGNDPLAVIDAMQQARSHIAAGRGPVLIDCQTYRQSGHSPSDPSSYRTKEELELWASVDPIVSYQSNLQAAGIADESVFAQWKDDAVASMTQALELAADIEISPRLDLHASVHAMADVTFNNSVTSDMKPSVGIDLDALPYAATVRAKSRAGVVDGKKLSGAKAITVRDALWEAIVERVIADDRVTLWGEENRDWGGAFGVYRGLADLLPRERLFNAPISEAAIVGTGVGYAMCGGRSLVELMYADFIGRAGDEILNQMAKWQAMSGGLLQLPIVLRVSVGAKYGAQHSQDWSSLVASVPGLKIAYPATPYDAKGLLTTALTGNDPVVFFESQRLYDTVELFQADGVPTASYALPFGEPAIVREGSDITFLTIGPTLYRAIEAAELLQERHGLSAEVIDARSMVPFNLDPVLESVAKTGRLVCASDANLRGSWMNTVAADVSQLAFDDLDGPVVVIGAQNWIAPPAELEWDYFPTASDFLDAIDERIVPLTGHVRRSVLPFATSAEQNRFGV
jgi:2-oxoisovalerate dehydrogenase E1 component